MREAGCQDLRVQKQGRGGAHDRWGQVLGSHSERPRASSLASKESAPWAERVGCGRSMPPPPVRGALHIFISTSLSLSFPLPLLSLSLLVSLCLSPFLPLSVFHLFFVSLSGLAPFLGSLSCLFLLACPSLSFLSLSV